MSDLHKSFLRRVKQQEQSLGLSSLSEDGDSDPSDTLAPLRSFSKPIGAHSSPRKQRTDDNHHNIIDEYNKAKETTFPIIEKWKDKTTNITFQVYYLPPKESESAVFIGCHGAGSSGMSFCKLAQSIRKKSNTSGMLVFDMRGHGSSDVPGRPDFSLTTLTNDFKFIISKFQSTYDPKSLYLLGHSLGGAILTNYLIQNPDNGFPIRGLIMLDIVEETAITSLGAMPKFLERMPRRFSTYKQAIDWHTKATGLFKNIESAHLSVPDLFVDTSKELHWKLDLSVTEPFWETWFKNLSENFVNCGKKQGVAKLLILAGHETLDTNLIIGQMQGKYQLIVFNNPQTGHFLHQDIPDELSISLIDFSKRNDSPEEYMQKELGFIPKWGGKINK